MACDLLAAVEQEWIFLGIEGLGCWTIRTAGLREHDPQPMGAISQVDLSPIIPTKFW